jgi:hypothetical protein
MRLPSTKYTYPKVHIYEQADQTLILDTGNYALHEITKATMLLQDSLRTSFDAMRTNCSISISKAQVKNLQMLFDLVLASALTASADRVMHNYTSSSTNMLPGQSLPTNQHKRTIVGRQIMSTSSTAQKASIYLRTQNMVLDTGVGSVEVEVLSAWSGTAPITLALTFEYLGYAHLGVSPFSVCFMSNKIERLFRCGPGVHEVRVASDENLTEFLSKHLRLGLNEDFKTFEFEMLKKLVWFLEDIYHRNRDQMLDNWPFIKWTTILGLTALEQLLIGVSFKERLDMFLDNMHGVCLHQTILEIGRAR